MNSQPPQTSPPPTNQAPPQQNQQSTMPQPQMPQQMQSGVSTQQQQQVPQIQVPQQQVSQQQVPQHLQTPNPTPPQQHTPYQPPPQLQQPSIQQAQQVPQQQSPVLSQRPQQTSQISHQHPQAGTPQIQQPQQQQNQPQHSQSQVQQQRPQIQTQYTGPAQQQPYTQQIPGQPRPYQAPPQPTGPQGYYATSQPPLKRQRVSPDPRSTPATPTYGSPYAQSPNTPQAPSFPNAIPQQPYQGPYSNPNPNPAPLAAHQSPYSAPPPQQSTYQPVQPNNLVHQQPPPLQPQPGYAPPPNQYQNNYTPLQHQPPPQQMTPAHGTMGPPPFRPATKDENANDDQMDVLANAGVNLREEETYAMSFYTGSFGSQPQFSKSGPNNVLGAGFTQFSPQGADSFYGAGPANQPGTNVDGKTQEEVQQEMANAAWKSATDRLALSRQHELAHPHTHVGALWTKMDKIARENGLILSTDKGQMPQLKLPAEFQTNTLQIKTVTGPEGTMVVADGTFLPQDTALADQLALMSLATNVRIRTILEETVSLARNRRLTSHGVIPEEYEDVAVELRPDAGTKVPDNGPRHDFESAVGVHAIDVPQQRLLRDISGNVNAAGRVQAPNAIVKSLRAAALKEREWEEFRLQQRAERRANPGGIPGAVSVASAGAPATPGVPGALGDIAPEPSAKPLTKKEREKMDKGKQSLVDSHAQANATTATFLFGGKKKNKYSWMAGGGASGASTPGRVGTGAGITGLGGAPEKVRLTQDGKNRMGGFREDKDGGKGVQLRDLVLCLENDGREKRALQRIYPWMDAPRPKPGPQL